MDLDLCLQTANQMLVENPRLKVKSVIDVGKADISQIKKCGAIDAICNKCGKKGHYAVICQKGKSFPHFSRSAHVVEASSSVSTSQTEPDFYKECGQPIYVQSHVMQTLSTKSQKIPEVQTTVWIPNQMTLQGSQPKGIA